MCLHSFWEYLRNLIDLLSPNFIMQRILDFTVAYYGQELPTQTGRDGLTGKKATNQYLHISAGVPL